MNSRAIIRRPCTFVSHNAEFPLVHFVNLVHPINVIHINLLVNVLIKTTNNYMTTCISICLKIATVTVPFLGMSKNLRPLILQVIPATGRVWGEDFTPAGNEDSDFKYLHVKPDGGRGSLSPYPL